MLINRLVKHGWRLVSYDYVGAEQVLGALNAYEKYLFREYYYRLSKSFETAQRTTDAEFYVLLTKGRMTCSKILAQKLIFYP